MAVVLPAVGTFLSAFLILAITRLWDYIWHPFFVDWNMERLTNYMGNLKTQYNDVKDRVISAGWELKAMQEEVSLAGSNLQTIQVITLARLEQQTSIQEEVASAGLEQHTSIQEVMRRLTKVESIEHEVDSIQNEYSDWKTKYSTAHRCWRRPLLGFKAFMKTREVSELLDQGYFKDVATKLPPPPAQELPSSPTVRAMDSNLAQTLHYLEKDGINIVAIWGMGGVGKTTLLKEINNYFAHNQHPLFDHVIFVVASKDVNVEELQKKILKELRLPLEGGDINSQATLLFNFLKNKKVLLLLDDLWKYINLICLGIPLKQGKCRVVFTTRLVHVCHCMKAKKEIKVECLKEEEAWSLFEENVGADIIKADRNIASLAEEVVIECHGLPLALITIGRAMSDKQTWREWQDALNLLRRSSHDEISGMPDDMFPILEFSYRNLQNDMMRECFLICSMWPEDYDISKYDLIKCWMGLGLIDDYHEINEAYDRGHSIIQSLIGACLLEHGGMKHERDDSFVKMHDVLRDLAFWIASDHGKNKNKWIVQADIGLKECKTEKWVGSHRISLMYNDIESLPTQLLDCPSLLFLTLRGNSLQNIPQGFFNYLRTLTYLDLSGSSIQELPATVDGLVNLKFLNLEKTGIKYLPDELGNLVNLKCLLLRGTRRMTSIPWKSISRLPMLKLLDMYFCGGAKNIESKGGFEALEQLDGRLVGLGISIYTISALNHLSRFSTISIVELHIEHLEGIECLDMLLPNHFESKSTSNSLKELHFSFCMCSETLIVNSQGLGGIPRLASLPRLEELELEGLPQLKKIVWRGVTPREFLPNLCVLRIWFCLKLKDVSWVLQLPNLGLLELVDCHELGVMIGDVEGSGGVGEVADRVDLEHILAFPKLMTLQLSSLPSLSNICSSIIPFPSLEEIVVTDCPKLKRLPFQVPNIPTNYKKFRVKQNGGNI